MFSESSTGSWAELQLPCYPGKQGELPENMLQNLLLNLSPQTVDSPGFAPDGKGERDSVAVQLFRACLRTNGLKLKKKIQIDIWEVGTTEGE